MREIIKRTLYPKTKRVGSSTKTIFITEKIDGSNLGIFRKENELIIAQRNNVFYYNPNTKETNLSKEVAYKGLQGWLEENGLELLENLHDKSGVFGEWIGMGKINYKGRLDKRFYIFAKANLDDEISVKNIYYNPSLFIYPFKNQTIPSFMGVVPLVYSSNSETPSIKELDTLYSNYVGDMNDWGEVLLNVEGFVINNNDVIRKYVRFKDGKLTNHTEKGE